jgi:hypothetical protein
MSVHRSSFMMHSQYMWLCGCNAAPWTEEPIWLPHAKTAALAQTTYLAIDQHQDLCQITPAIKSPRNDRECWQNSAQLPVATSPENARIPQARVLREPFCLMQ